MLPSNLFGNDQDILGTLPCCKREQIVKLDFQKDGYLFLTDDTSKLDKDTLFLKTAQNSVYYDKLEVKPETITGR